MMFIPSTKRRTKDYFKNDWIDSIVLIGSENWDSILDKRLYCKFTEILVSIINLSLKIQKYNINRYEKIKNKMNLTVDLHVCIINTYINYVDFWIRMHRLKVSYT